MEDQVQKKILRLDALVKKVGALKKKGKTVVQSHGVFDLIHPGIIQHLNSARKQGDVLIVSVVRDEHVRRGPGRPVFPDEFRALNVAALTQVDYVCVVDDETPFESVRLIQPDVFARGQAYKERDRQLHAKIFEEEKEFYLGKSRIAETDGFSFSSSQIIKQLLEIYPEETRDYLKEFSARYPFETILDHLEDLRDLKVLVVGDGILDEYHYCEPLGKAAKANLVVHRFLGHEAFAGGAFAVANHVAGLCDRVQLVSLLGREDSREDFIQENLKPNVTPHFFYRDDGPTIVKKRYVHPYLNQKLFEVNYINDAFVEPSRQAEMIETLDRMVPDYDLVLICDFGHGFISKDIFQAVKNKARVLAVNAQTNAANTGYNLITKYERPDFVCVDEMEMRLAAQDKHESIDQVARRIRQAIQTKGLIVTLGKKGALGVDDNGQSWMIPIFSTRVVDTIGAGDAFFAFTAPCFALGLPMELITFLGNAVGALAVQVVCNKRPVEKHELVSFVRSLVK